MKGTFEHVKCMISEDGEREERLLFSNLLDGKIVDTQIDKNCTVREQVPISENEFGFIRLYIWMDSRPMTIC